MPTDLITTKEASIASSFIPYPYDDRRGKFLALRACGLNVKESLAEIDATKGELDKWRNHDQLFNHAELTLPDIRKNLSHDYLRTQFTRNMAMFLKKDRQVIQEALEDGELSEQVQTYLLKIRHLYTGKELQLIEGLMGDNAKPQGFATLIEKAKGNITRATERTVEFGNTES